MISPESVPVTIDNLQQTPSSSEALVHEPISVELDSSIPTQHENLFSAIKEDIRTSESPKRTVGLGALALGTQIADRIRLVAILAPPAAISVMENTGNPALAGITAAGIFAGINYANGEALTHGLGAYPRALKTFNEKHPAIVSVFEQSLPGMLDDTRQDANKQRVSSRIGTRVRRSMAGIGLGSTAFVATASTRGKTQSEVRKINTDVTVDGAVGVFGIAGGLTWGLKELAMNGQYQTAENINNVVGDTRTWIALAAVSAVSEFMANRKKAHELRQKVEAPVSQAK